MYFNTQSEAESHKTDFQSIVKIGPHFVTLSKDIARRVRIEKRIFSHVAKKLIEAGYKLSLHDGEEYVVKRSQSVAELIKAAMSTDSDSLHCSGANDSYAGCIVFIYGNDGWDVISDYSTNLEPILETVFEWIEKKTRHRTKKERRKRRS